MISLSRHPLALLALVGLATPTLGAGPALESHPATATVAVPRAISAKLAARLRAAGLDPADPNLHARLLQLSSAKTHVLNAPALAMHAVANLTPAATFHVLPPSPALLESMANTPIITNVTFGNVIDVQGFNYVVPGFDVAPAQGSLSVPPCGPPEALSQIVQGGDLSFRRDRFVVSPTPATLTITIKGHTSAPAAFTIAPVTGPDFTSDIGVNSGPGLWADPHAGAISVGLTGSSLQMTNSATRDSNDVNDPESSGVDTLAYGVNVVNGWTATAAITSVSSKLDGPSSQNVSDDFRSATILQQPQNGRLETKIAWKYEGGESLAYWVTWTFHGGTMGARPVDAVPKMTGCPGEQ